MTHIDLTHPSRPWWHQPLHTALNWSVKWVAGSIIAVGVPLVLLNAMGVM